MACVNLDSFIDVQSSLLGVCSDLARRMEEFEKMKSSWAEDQKKRNEEAKAAGVEGVTATEEEAKMKENMAKVCIDVS